MSKLALPSLTPAQETIFYKRLEMFMKSMPNNYTPKEAQRVLATLNAIPARAHSISKSSTKNGIRRSASATKSPPSDTHSTPDRSIKSSRETVRVATGRIRRSSRKTRAKATRRPSQDIQSNGSVNGSESPCSSSSGADSGNKKSLGVRLKMPGKDLANLERDERMRAALILVQFSRQAWEEWGRGE